MTDSTRFEGRLTVALGRYADRVPVDVDPILLAQGLARATAGPRIRPRVAVNRLRLSLAVLVIVGVALAGLAVFGGRIVAPVPPVVVSPSPSTSAATVTPSPAASSTPIPTTTPAPSAAVLHWTEQDIGTQPAVSSIWRVGDWFVAVGPESSFAADDQAADTQFIRSRDGQAWESAPAPARGLEVETGTVADGVLWVVGKLGTSAEPKRGIWTTQDGATWQRVADVTGLDFGPGRIGAISRANAGWLAIAGRWIHAESQETFLLNSADGVAWTRSPYPDSEARYGADGLASDGDRWLMVTASSPGTGSEVWALTSTNGTDWTETRIATMARGPGAPAAIEPAAVTFGPGGFVVVGQQLEGEYPHAIAWVSPDGLAWTQAVIAGLPDPAGETGLQSVVAFGGGYLASGYRLNDSPSFWTSIDGSSWAQVDDLFGGDEDDVQALGASGTTYVAGGQTGDGGAFLWTAPH
jgi:hypothetical protein